MPRLPTSRRSRTSSTYCTKPSERRAKSRPTRRLDAMTAVPAAEAGSSTAARPASVDRLAAQAAGSDESLLRRFHAVRAFARTFRPSEYHITNACNLRCKGCWFFSYDYDKRTRDQSNMATLKAFIERGRT